MGYYVTDWVNKSGFIPLLMTEFALIIGPAIIGGVFFYYFGKKFRKMSRNAKVHSY